jgi:hypothetical protein
MRILALRLLLLCGLVSACGASDTVRQSSTRQAPNPSSSDLFNSSSIADYDSVDLAASDPARNGDVTCYTMHIFGMKRQSPDSDVTEPDGQWTCRRASKYSMKTVEEPGKIRSRWNSAP